MAFLKTFLSSGKNALIFNLMKKSPYLRLQHSSAWRKGKTDFDESEIAQLSSARSLKFPQIIITVIYNMV